MRKICLLNGFIVAIFALILPDAAWAHRPYNHYRSPGYFPGGYNIGLGFGTGYGFTNLGYRNYYGYGGRRSGFYGSYSFGVPYAPYYSRPYYGGYGGYMPFPSYSYYPPVVVVPATPPVYIQQPSAQPPSPPPETNYWHYCENPAGYYPYVKKCPGGWLKVAPQPAE